MIFSKTRSEILPSKNPKTLKLYPQAWYVEEKFQVIVEFYISLEK